ncbi:MAG: iron ABC transporter permease [Bryobacteraceae bacterium]|nr:iron ABC transporter permease [Bryobacteraceae bacterium]
MAVDRRLATSSRVWTVAIVSLAVFVACGLLLPLIGAVPVEYARAFAGGEPDHQILFTLRVPRVFLALLTGGALALAGVLFQALLRDALATPYTLGVSSGASLGAVSAISFGWTTLWPASIVGAVVTLAVVLGVAAERRRLSPFTLLMAGVTVNSICMAGILFLHSVATFAQSISITRWLMGGIEAVDMPTLTVLSVILLSSAVYVFWRARQWNLLAVGEEWAAVRGVEGNRLIFIGYVIGSLLTGTVTALTGPIGFVGLIVPHALRIRLGADHRLLIPGSFLLGGAFLAICDTVARTAMAPSEIPVGVITAILGGPFFIWLLRHR